MTLKSIKDCQKFFVHTRKLSLQRVKIFGVANACNNIFALRVNQIVTVWFVLARRSVAREADTRARIVVAIAEHHRLHIDRSAEVVANFFANAIRNRSRAVP